MPNRLINLTFHGIGSHERKLEPGEDTVWVSLDRFTTVLDAVAGRDDIHITFDDGNRSDLVHALPELRRRGLRGTFFVVAGRLGLPGFLSADDVRALADAGMAIGSHGMRHVPWRKLGATALDDELVVAKTDLERVLGQPVTTAAFPFGAYGRHSLAALRKAGYAHVYTSDGGPARDGSWLQARTSITERGPLEPVLAGTIAAPRRMKQVLKRWR